MVSPLLRIDAYTLLLYEEAILLGLWLTTVVFCGRAAVVFSLQSWLGESEESKNNSATPGYFGVGMSRKWKTYRTFTLELRTEH